MEPIWKDWHPLRIALVAVLLVLSVLMAAYFHAHPELGRRQVLPSPFRGAGAAR